MRIAQDKDNAAGLVAAVKEMNAMHGFNEPSKLELTGGTNNVNRVEFLVVNT